MSLLNCPEQTLDRRFFPFGRIGIEEFQIDFFFQLVKLEQMIFWIEDFQLVKMEQTIFGQTIFNLVNGRVILEERIFINGPRKLRGDRGNEFRNKLTIIIAKKNYIYTHTHTQWVKKRHIWGPVASLNLMLNSIVSHSSLVDKNYLYTYNFVTKILAQYFTNKPACFLL